MFQFSYYKWRAVINGFITVLLLTLLPLSGCTNSSGPVEPSLYPDLSESTSGQAVSNRYLLSQYDLFFNEDRTSCELTPAREGTLHLNVLHFVEFFAPGNVAVDDWYLHEDGTLTVAILFRHPFDIKEYTLFDLRGIMMMPAAYWWPEHVVNTPGMFVGQSALLNPDGFTRRWNPYEFMDKPVPFSYFDGALTKGMGEFVETVVNPYRTYWTDTNRMYFLAGNEVINHFHLSIDPGQARVGLAFDCSWEEPIVPSAGSLMIPGHFPLTANSIEAYDIQIAGLEGQLECSVGEYAGGSQNVHVNVKSWQKEAYVFFTTVNLEIPDLFEGVINPWTGGGTSSDFTYQFNISNPSIKEPGQIVGLMSVESAKKDGTYVEGMPLTAYQLLVLDIVEVAPPMCNSSTAIHSTFGGSFSLNGSNGITHLDSSFLPKLIGGEGALFFDGGIEGGVQRIQAAAIPPLGGNVSTNTLIKRTGYNAGNSLVVQSNEYNGHLYVVSDSDPDNFLIFDGTGALLKEFDLGDGENGHNEPVSVTTDPSNGDVWLIGDKGNEGIHLERLVYLEQGEPFDYVFHTAAKIDLSPWLGSDPKPLGIGINTYYKRLYMFHARNNGSVEVFDISVYPPVHLDEWSSSSIFLKEITPTQVAGLRKYIGGDLVIDHVDGDFEGRCKILIFANTYDGSSMLVKLDVWAQTISTANLGSPYSCMALSNLTAPSDRSLVFFPMPMVNEYMIYYPQAGW